MKKITLKKITLLSFIALYFIGCDSQDGQKIDLKYNTLVWEDNFDGLAGTLPDATKWVYDIGTGTNGWGNKELQYYTNRPENISKDGNGNLVITALNQSYLGSAYTSARIKTKGKLDQKYGRFEARIRAPYGQGLWPAFWMLGSNIDTVTWPLCGEIDIMEIRGQKPNITNSALHGPGFSGANPITYAYTLMNGRFDTDFHVFAVEWSQNKINFFVDNYLFKSITKTEVETKGTWVYDNPFFLILNVAVGGNFGGDPNNTTVFPQKMIIDYVRVYQ